MGFKARSLPKPDPRLVLSAIENFLPRAESMNLYDELVAAGQCVDVSRAFAAELRAQGVIDVQVKQFRHSERRFRFPYQTEFEESHCDWHAVVKVGNLFIDWTARQFHPSAPLPTIWEA